jgi:hypothetical protein
MLMFAVLVVMCAAGLAPPAMAMAGGQDCSGPGCEHQIACGQPVAPQIPAGFSFDLVAMPAARERVLGPTKIDTRAVGPSPAGPAWQSRSPLGSRSPPAV